MPETNNSSRVYIIITNFICQTVFRYIRIVQMILMKTMQKKTFRQMKKKYKPAQLV